MSFVDKYKLTFHVSSDLSFTIIINQNKFGFLIIHHRNKDLYIIINYYISSPFGA